MAAADAISQKNAVQHPAKAAWIQRLTVRRRAALAQCLPVGPHLGQARKRGWRGGSPLPRTTGLQAWEVGSHVFLHACGWGPGRAMKEA